MEEDLIEEITNIINGYEDEETEDWIDEEGYFDCDKFEEVEKNFVSGGEDQYLYMEHIFKYKDRFFSVEINENSCGDSGVDTDTLREVFPKQKLVTVYE